MKRRSRISRRRDARSHLSLSLSSMQMKPLSFISAAESSFFSLLSGVNNTTDVANHLAISFSNFLERTVGRGVETGGIERLALDFTSCRPRPCIARVTEGGRSETLALANLTLTWLSCQQGQGHRVSSLATPGGGFSSSLPSLSLPPTASKKVAKSIFLSSLALRGHRWFSSLIFLWSTKMK